MKRIAMIAALVGLSAAPAFAASQNSNTPPANPPTQSAQPPRNQQQIDHKQTQLDQQQQRIDQHQAKLDQQQLQHGQSQAQNNPNGNSSHQGNGSQDQNTAMNRQGSNGNGQARASQSAYQQHRRTLADRETKALNMLEAHGYAQFTDFHRIHNGLFGARVDRNGRWMSVQVNPLDDQIMRG